MKPQPFKCLDSLSGENHDFLKNICQPLQCLDSLSIENSILITLFVKKMGNVRERLRPNISFMGLIDKIISIHVVKCLDSYSLENHDFLKTIKQPFQCLDSLSGENLNLIKINTNQPIQSQAILYSKSSFFLTIKNTNKITHFTEDNLIPKNLNNMLCKTIVTSNPGLPKSFHIYYNKSVKGGDNKNGIIF